MNLADKKNLQKLTDEAADLLESLHPTILKSYEGKSDLDCLILSLNLSRLFMGSALIVFFENDRDMDKIKEVVDGFSEGLSDWAENTLPLSFECLEATKH